MAPLAWPWGVRGRALSHHRPLVLSGVRPGPTTHWLWVRGLRAWGLVTNLTARALASWLCTLWGRHEGAQGGAPLAWPWGVRGQALSHPRPLVRSGVRPGPTINWLWVRGVRAWGPVTNPRARALTSWPCALWARHEGATGGRLLPGCGASGIGRSPTPDHSSFRACGWGPLPTGCGCGGCGRGYPSPTPQRGLLRAGFARCGGSTRAPGGGASCLGVGRPGTGALPPPTTRPFGRAAGARFPLAVGAVCGRAGRAVLGSLPRTREARTTHHEPRHPVAVVAWHLSSAVVVAGGVPLWRASWPRVGAPRLVRSGCSPCSVGFPVAVVPSPTPGAVAPGFTGWLRGECGGWPRTGLFVPAAGPYQGKGAGRAPRCTRSGPRNGVVPGRSLRLWSSAARAAVVWRVWTRSLTRPVSRTVRLSTGDSAGAPGLFRVDEKKIAHLIWAKKVSFPSLILARG